MKETEAAAPPLAPRDGQALRGQPWTWPPGRHSCTCSYLCRPRFYPDQGLGKRGGLQPRWGVVARAGL